MACGPKVAQFGGIIKKLLVKLSAFKGTPSTSAKNFNIKNQLREGGREISGAFTTLLMYTFLDHANHSCFPPYPVPQGRFLASV
jgi:hypothetical protein